MIDYSMMVTPAMKFEAAKQAKRDEIARARYEAEIAGITINGMRIKTDRESQALITGAALKAMQDPSYTCSWKTESGFVTLDSPTILYVADKVREHVQSCFNREEELAPLIEAATTTQELEAITY